MNVLVLGGNGYIGSKVVRELIIKGHKVVCTKRGNSNLSRLEDLKNQIKWIPASVDAVETVTQYVTFDYVLNMACNYGRSNVLYDDVIEANIEFPLKVLNVVVESGTKNFLTIGTGLPDDLNMYSFSKKMFGEFGQFYVKNHDINFNCLRLEMFYGADEPKNRFLPYVICNMIQGLDVNTTSGTQKRDIIAAEDIVESILLVIENTPLGYNEIPIGTGEAPTISEVIDFIWNETGKKSKVHKGVIPMRKNEPDCIADISFIKTIGAWNPVSWKDGIRKMIRTMEKEFEEDK